MKPLGERAREAMRLRHQSPRTEEAYLGWMRRYHEFKQTLLIPSGSELGDLHMSLIATANGNGVEPVAYLTERLENHEDLARRPEYYFPWVYRARLDAREAPGAPRW